MAAKLAIVTGASSGIGLSLAKELAGRGFDLAISSAGERLKTAAEELEASGARVFAIRQDLATRDGIQRFWKELESLARDVDVACLNAGVGVGGLFAEADLDAELNMVNLNCTGTVQLAKYVVQHMVPRKRGKILFTASIAGEMVAPRQAVYAATKAFVLSLAHSIRYELRDLGSIGYCSLARPDGHGFFPSRGNGQHASRFRRKIREPAGRRCAARYPKLFSREKITSTRPR